MVLPNAIVNTLFAIYFLQIFQCVNKMNYNSPILLKTSMKICYETAPMGNL